MLAVDADANANLNEVLGVEAGVTLGELREEIERAGVDPKYKIPAGITKAAYLESRLADALTEEDDYDLMVMGRSQGQGCYCFVNGIVQTQVQKLQSHYPYIVVDNEAGMEHISRGILPNMEVAILVSDCSPERRTGSRKDRGIDEGTEFPSEKGRSDREPGAGRKTGCRNSGRD